MIEKRYLAKLAVLTGHHTWEAYIEMLDFYIDNNRRKLEQTTDMSEVYRAQGAIMALRALTKLKDEINGLRKETQ